MSAVHPDERAAVAREVLTELADAFRKAGSVVRAMTVEHYRDTHYPAPAAPETVTVDAGNGMGMQTVTKGTEGQWRVGTRWIADAGSPLGAAYDRIAVDARRIAELERDVVDAAKFLRAKDERIAELEREVEELRDRDRTADDARANLLLQTICRLPDVLTTGDWQEWLDAHRHQWLNDDRAFGGWIADRLSAHMTRVERERDEARRALDALEARQTLDGIKARAEAAFASATTSQGEGLGASDELPNVIQRSEAPNGDEGAAHAEQSPAPIPLGAVVSTIEYEYEFDRLSLQWECMQGDPPVGHPVDREIEALCDLAYQLQHPVATRETVERVARELDDHIGLSTRARVCLVLRALGYTIQEGV